MAEEPETNIVSTSRESKDKEDIDDAYSSSILYCSCRHPILCKKCGQNHTDREQTKKSIDHLVRGIRPNLTNVFGNGPLLVSDIPSTAVTDQYGVVLGIDEAGRGSVLGPMVYGCAYWSADPRVEVTIPKDFNDSKQLKEEQREKLWKKILDNPNIGFCARSILPSEISRNMLRKSNEVYNLNEQSHDAAMTIIQKVLNAGVNVVSAYIDTVGHPGYYKIKLEREFPTIQFVVESKADAKYPPCSAASVVAKVLRDQMLDGWQYSEPGMEGRGELISKRQFGSGYPSDPICKMWIQKSMTDPVFGFSDIIRFSWAPTKQRLSGSEPDATDAAKVTFLADLDDEEEENMKQSKGMAQFLNTTFQGGKNNSGTSKRKRSAFFDSRKIKVARSIV